MDWIKLKDRKPGMDWECLVVYDFGPGYRIERCYWDKDKSQFIDIDDLQPMEFNIVHVATHWIRIFGPRK